MHITYRHWTVQFGLIWLAISLLAAGLFYHLGSWQLQRYQNKKEWVDGQTELTINGQFLPNFNLFIDNKILHGIPGYEVLQAFQFRQDTQPPKIVLISRGWVAQPKNNQQYYTRDVLPKIIPPQTTPDQPSIQLTAKTINTTPSKYGITHLELNLNPHASMRHITIRASRLDMAEIAKMLHQHEPSLTLVSDYYLSLPQDSSYQLTSLPEVKTWLNPHKHLGYAVQWFAFCLITVFLFIKFGIRVIQTPAEKNSKLPTGKLG